MVEEVAALCQPDAIHWCDGCRRNMMFCADHGGNRNFIRLNRRSGRIPIIADPIPAMWRASSSSLLSARKIAGMPNQITTGPNPRDEEKAGKLFAGAMRGRTMYVIPYSMALSVRHRQDRRRTYGLAYVVVNMDIMTRVGKKVLEVLASTAIS